MSRDGGWQGWVEEEGRCREHAGARNCPGNERQVTEVEGSLCDPVGMLFINLYHLLVLSLGVLFLV